MQNSRKYADLLGRCQIFYDIYQGIYIKEQRIYIYYLESKNDCKLQKYYIIFLQIIRAGVK